MLPSIPRKNNQNRPPPATERHQRPHRRTTGDRPPPDCARRAPHDDKKNQMSKSVRVLKLTPAITKEDLRQAFSRCGPVRDVYIPRDFQTNLPRSFGFVKYFTVHSAKVAVSKMDGCLVKGRQLEVELAESSRKSSDEMARLGKRSSRNEDAMSQSEKPPTRKRRFSDDGSKQPSVEHDNPLPTMPTADVVTLCRVFLRIPDKRESGWLDSGAPGTPFKKAVNALDSKSRFQRAREQATRDGYIEFGRRNKTTGRIVSFSRGDVQGPGYSSNGFNRLTAKGCELVKRNRNRPNKNVTRRARLQAPMSMSTSSSDSHEKVASSPIAEDDCSDDKEEAGSTLFVQNVSKDISRDDLFKIFGRIGDIKSVDIPLDSTSMPRGFALVEYTTTEAALEARWEMDEYVMKGQVLRVTVSLTHRRKSVDVERDNRAKKLDAALSCQEVCDRREAVAGGETAASVEETSSQLQEEESDDEMLIDLAPSPPTKKNDESTVGESETSESVPQDAAIEDRSFSQVEKQASGAILHGMEGVQDLQQQPQVQGKADLVKNEITEVPARHGGVHPEPAVSEYDKLLAQRKAIDQQLELLARRREIDLQLEHFKWAEAQSELLVTKRVGGVDKYEAIQPPFKRQRTLPTHAPAPKSLVLPRTRSSDDSTLSGLSSVGMPVPDPVVSHQHHVAKDNQDQQQQQARPLQPPRSGQEEEEEEDDSEDQKKYGTVLV